MTAVVYEHTACPGADELAALRREAHHLHRGLFRREAPLSLVENYLQAHAAMPELHAASTEQLRTVRIIVANRLDAAAIEPWLRGGRVRHILSRKLLLIAYLAECGAQHPEFRRRARGHWQGWFNMAYAALLSGIILLHGRYLQVRHGLV